jgi:hypothetical protein
MTEGCHLAEQQTMRQVGFLLKELSQAGRMRADPNRPRLRQGSDPAESLYREQARRDSEIAHQYLNELTNRRAGR